MCNTLFKSWPRLDKSWERINKSWPRLKKMHMSLPEFRSVYMYLSCFPSPPPPPPLPSFFFYKTQYKKFTIIGTKAISYLVLLLQQNFRVSYSDLTGQVTHQSVRHSLYLILFITSNLQFVKVSLLVVPVPTTDQKVCIFII